MKRVVTKPSVESDRLMKRMRRASERAVALKNGGVKAAPRIAPMLEPADAAPRRPMLLALSELKRINDPSLLYRSPLTVAAEHLAQGASEEDEDHAARETAQWRLAEYRRLRPTTPLWPFQQTAVAFARAREADTEGVGCRGLMLCDEMGMGKSKDALTVVLEANQEAAGAPGGRRFNGATLVVCTNILIKGWLAEVANFPRGAFEYFVLTSSSGGVGVVVGGDGPRSAGPRSVDPFYYHHCCDLVFTTYATLAAVYKKHRQARKRRRRRRSGGGEDDDDEKYRILYGTEWRRVIADEAQACVVRQRTVTRAVDALRAQSKWVMSGTPTQNRRSDLVTLMHLIGLRGLTERSADLISLRQKVMLYRRLKDEQAAAAAAASSPGGARMPEFKGVTRRVELVAFRTLAERMLYYAYARYARQKKSRRDGATTIDVIQLLRQLCVNPDVVRRLALPRGMLALGGTHTRDTLAAEQLFPGGGGADEVGARRGGVLLRHAMSQFGDAPLRVAYSEGGAYTGEADDDAEILHSSAQCAEFTWAPFAATGAFDLRNDAADREHYAALCSQLAATRHRWALPEDAAQPAQPAEKTRAMLGHIIERTVRLDMPSSKEAALLDYVRGTPRDDKVIIYSNYVGVLVSLDRWLRGGDRNGAGVRTVLVTSKTNTRDDLNDALLQSFMTEPAVKVLLITLKLGSAGLNLSVANHVLFCDLWWAPFAMAQAEHRVQRAGQRKHIHVVYFVMDQTIEMYMMNHALRKKRLLLAQLAARPDQVQEAEGEEPDPGEQLRLFDYRVDIAPL